MQQSMACTTKLWSYEYLSFHRLVGRSHRPVIRGV
jgi:hypothetical protein